MRTGLLVAAVLAASGAMATADEKPARSLDEDRKALAASLWVNEKPEAAWAKLSPEHQKQHGGKPWSKIGLDIQPLHEIDTKGRTVTHSLKMSFYTPGSDEPKRSVQWIELRESGKKRHFVMTNADGLEYKVEYRFTEKGLWLAGSFVQREKLYAPKVFDGEYVGTPRPTK